MDWKRVIKHLMDESYHHGRQVPSELEGKLLPPIDATASRVLLAMAQALEAGLEEE